MASWTDKDLLALDRRYAEQGVHLHQRPFRAAMDILKSEFVMGLGGNPAVEQIQKDYERLVPEVNSTWPGMGIGLAASVDRVRKFVMPVAFGTVRIEPWRILGFASPQEWWSWCREDQAIAAETAFAVADMFDFSYAMSDGDAGGPEAATLWQMAASNLEDVANNLPAAFSVDSVIQPICMIAELSLKALLVAGGASPNSFKGKDGHNLAKLAQDVASKKPHRDDPLVANLISNLPPYVASRYSPAGLPRVKVVRLALGAQFVAASTLRRVSSRDMAEAFEKGDFPGKRPQFFGSTD